MTGAVSVALPAVAVVAAARTAVAVRALDLYMQGARAKLAAIQRQGVLRGGFRGEGNKGGLDVAGVAMAREANVRWLHAGVGEEGADLALVRLEGQVGDVERDGASGGAGGGAVLARGAVGRAGAREGGAEVFATGGRA